MLVIPAMHISEGRCTRTASGEDGTEGQYPFDPALLARLWRVENAKSLHLVDEDCLREFRPLRRDLVRSVVEAVDIPVQLAGRFVSIEDVQRVFVECGIYRIVLDANASQDYEFVSALVDMFGPRRIVVTIILPADAESGEHGGSVRIDDALQSAERCRQSGVQRVIVRDAGASSDGRPPQLEALYSFADRTKLSITADTGVRGYRDLKNLQDLHPAKIDSIILHDALYSNSFPCQKIWRLAEKELIARHRLL